MTARGERAKSFLRGLLRFVGLIVVAGGIGVALGMVLSSLSSSDGATSDAGPELDVPAATPTATPPPAAGPDPLTQVRVSVVDARLFTDGAPSGGEEQSGRMTVRVQAENTGDEHVTLGAPLLRVGSVRIPADGDGPRLDALAAGAIRTATLRFVLTGDATPKVVRDRRARILIAGQSVVMRVKVRAPAG